MRGDAEIDGFLYLRRRAWCTMADAGGADEHGEAEWWALMDIAITGDVDISPHGISCSLPVCSVPVIGCISVFFHLLTPHRLTALHSCSPATHQPDTIIISHSLFIDRQDSPRQKCTRTEVGVLLPQQHFSKPGAPHSAALPLLCSDRDHRRERRALPPILVPPDAETSFTTATSGIEKT